MESDFWHQRWNQKEIGFHKENPNTYLTSHWRELNIPRQSLVFVPLCGKSRDMLWLKDHGYSILGVELSEIAVQDFFADLNIDPIVTQQGDLILYASPNVSIYCGDIFSLHSEHLNRVRAVYDRGALVALPEKMRRAYVAHLSAHLPDTVSGLLITKEYDQSLMAGPPFSVPKTEIHRLFDDFDVSDIAFDDIDFREKPVRIRIWKYTRG